MEIILPNAATVKLIGHPSKIKDWRASRKVKVPGAEYTKAFKRGWDGYTKPGRARFSKKTYTYRLTLGRGWLPDILRCFPDVDPQYEFESACTLNLDAIENSVWEMLRDYQRESLQKIKDNRWGRIALATNSGKGAIIALAAVAAHPHKTIVLADEVSVFDALREEVTKWSGEEPGLVESGAKNPPDDTIVVAMVPTLRERLKGKGKEAAKWLDFLESFHVALLDEADKATSDTWQIVCKALVNTEYRAGFSGSFPKAGSIDDFNLMGILGTTLIRVKNKELVRRDISAKPRVQLVTYDIPPIPEFKGNHSAGPEYRNWVYEHGIIGNPERHCLVRDLLHPSAPNAIIVNRIKHGEQLEEWINDAIFLSGSDSKKKRRAVLEQFQNGDFQNLIATNILDRGTNRLGDAVGLIFASAAGSARQTLQRIGRGLRKGEDKEFIFLRDIMDRGNRFVEKASKKRVAVYHKEDFDIEIYNDPGEIDDG